MIELTINDIKQWLYCPRVVYYSYTLPVRTKKTSKMERGVRVQEQIERHEVRRALKRYGLNEGEREFNLWISSSRYGLSGRLDMLIRTPNECCPVDFKNSRRKAWEGWRLQVAAYGLLCLDEDIGPVDRGFVYLVPIENIVEVKLNNDAYERVLSTVGEISDVLEREAIPEPPSNTNKCVDCEYRNFCNDVF